jgi:ribosomal protein L17
LFELQNKKDELIEWILQNRANNIAKSNSIDTEIKRLTEIKKLIDKKVEKSDKFIDFIIKKDYKDKPMII